MAWPVSLTFTSDFVVMSFHILFCREPSNNVLYTFAHLNRRFIYRHLGIAEMLNITKEVYQCQSNSCQSTVKDAEPYGSAFRMCNGVKYLVRFSYQWLGREPSNNVFVDYLVRFSYQWLGGEPRNNVL